MIKPDKTIIPKLLVSVLALASLNVSAVPFTFEARSLGMGGTNVATADLATAAWANPAMLTNQRASDDFSLLIGVGAFLRDNDDLVTDVDDFQAANDRLDQAADGSPEEVAILTDMSAIVRRIDGKVIAPEATGVLAVGAAFDSWAMAISARGDVIAGGTVTDLACDLADPGCDLATFKSQIESDEYNILNIEGVLATELGVAFATAFPVMERKFSIGVKPKIVDLQGVTFTESIRTADVGFDNLSDEDNNFDIGTFTSIDLGLAYDISESVRLGLNVTNLLTDEFELQNHVLNFDTGARLGVAYHSAFVTLAVDYDLIENEPLLANPAFDGLKTQFLNLGAEFNAFDFAQLRLGASRNMASGVSDTAKDTAYTAGIGFWLGFNLDIAATLTDNTVGGFLQTGFRF